MLKHMFTTLLCKQIKSIIDLMTLVLFAKYKINNGLLVIYNVYKI